MMTDERERAQAGPASPPRLAVVIPCYNSEAWIGRTIRSVLSQDCADLVLIVVDDGSTDGSVGRVQAFGDRVLLETGPNRGACHARNHGMRLARAQGATHVLFLDADDYLEGDMLAGAARVARATGAQMVLSNLHHDHADGGRENRFVYTGQVAPDVFFEGWMQGRNFIPSSVLWRIDFVEEVGGWDETLSRSQDTDISLRAMFHQPLIFKNEDGAAVYTAVNPTSVSRVNSRRATESRLKVYIRLIEKAKGTPFERFIPLMISKLYAVTRIAFQTGQIDLGRQGVAAMRGFGFRDNPGSPRHRRICNLIGLEAKVRLWGN